MYFLCFVDLCLLFLIKKDRRKYFSIFLLILDPFMIFSLFSNQPFSISFYLMSYCVVIVVALLLMCCCCCWWRWFFFLHFFPLRFASDLIYTWIYPCFRFELYMNLYSDILLLVKGFCIDIFFLWVYDFLMFNNLWRQTLYVDIVLRNNFDYLVTFSLKCCIQTLHVEDASAISVICEDEDWGWKVWRRRLR